MLIRLLSSTMMDHIDATGYDNFFFCAQSQLLLVDSEDTLGLSSIG